jgi:hypothetical protein
MGVQVEGAIAFPYTAEHALLQSQLRPPPGER